MNDESDRMNGQLKRYKKLVNDRNLAERNELSKSLVETQDKLYEVERRNQVRVCSKLAVCTLGLVSSTRNSKKNACFLSWVYFFGFILNFFLIIFLFLSD